MNQGDVLLTPVPQADGVIKNRPAIFLRELPPYRDALVCGISTQLNREVKGFDEVVRLSDPDFAATGLRSASLIRLGFLAVLPRRCSDTKPHLHLLYPQSLQKSHPLACSSCP